VQLQIVFGRAAGAHLAQNSAWSHGNFQPGSTGQKSCYIYEPDLACQGMCRHGGNCQACRCMAVCSIFCSPAAAKSYCPATHNSAWRTNCCQLDELPRQYWYTIIISSSSLACRGWGSLHVFSARVMLLFYTMPHAHHQVVRHLRQVPSTWTKKEGSWKLSECDTSLQADWGATRYRLMPHIINELRQPPQHGGLYVTAHDCMTRKT
jgi:hypothetical protein